MDNRAPGAKKMLVIVAAAIILFAIASLAVNSFDDKRVATNHDSDELAAVAEENIEPSISQVKQSGLKAMLKFLTTRLHELTSREPEDNAY